MAYTAHNLQSQRKATVNVFRGVKDIVSTFSEEKLFFNSHMTHFSVLKYLIPNMNDCHLHSLDLVLINEPKFHKAI